MLSQQQHTACSRAHTHRLMMGMEATMIKVMMVMMMMMVVVELLLMLLQMLVVVLAVL